MRAQEFLAKDTLEDLVSLLTKAKIAHRLTDFAPPGKRAFPEFRAHLKVCKGVWTFLSDILYSLKYMNQQHANELFVACMMGSLAW